MAGPVAFHSHRVGKVAGDARDEFFAPVFFGGPEDPLALELGDGALQKSRISSLLAFSSRARQRSQSLAAAGSSSRMLTNFREHGVGRFRCGGRR